MYFAQFFNVISIMIRGAFMSVVMQSPRIVFIFYCILTPVCFKGKILIFFKLQNIVKTPKIYKKKKFRKICCIDIWGTEYSSVLSLKFDIKFIQKYILAYGMPKQRVWLNFKHLQLEKVLAEKTRQKFVMADTHRRTRIK